jgi:hypothetical protein
MHTLAHAQEHWQEVIDVQEAKNKVRAEADAAEAAGAAEGGSAVEGDEGAEADTDVVVAAAGPVGNTTL